MDENGNHVEYKNEINYMIHRAEILPFDRVLGFVTDEADALSKCRTILLNIYRQEYIDNHEKTFEVRNPDDTKTYQEKTVLYEAE